MYDKKKIYVYHTLREKKKPKTETITMKSFYLYEDFRLTDANE